jgi:type IV secretory pathway VirB10-like protein
MAERSSFRKMLDRTKPNNLSVFPESELRDCENFFLEVQSDSTLPPDEIITASERLALIRSEIALRHSDAKHRQTQRLARWAIALGMISVAVAITSGVAQFLASKATRETWHANIAAPIVATPTPMELPTATPGLTAAPPTTTPEPTVPPPTATPELTPKPTPRRTPTEQRRKKRRTRPETTKKTDPIRELLRSLSRPKPTPRSGSESEQ